jgi:hypothetical protein
MGRPKFSGTFGIIVSASNSDATLFNVFHLPKFKALTKSNDTSSETPMFRSLLIVSKEILTISSIGAIVAVFRW